MVTPSIDSEREELYFRHIDYVGYRRADGLWDIDGRFLDRRTVDCPCVDRGGMIPAGETFHEMLLRLTVDDDMVIRGLAVKINKHPYRQCPAAEAAFKNAEGLLIGAAGAAFQTLAQVRMMKYCRGVKPDPLDTCLAWDSSGEMVKREWPDFYREKEMSEEEK